MVASFSALSAQGTRKKPAEPPLWSSSSPVSLAAMFAYESSSKVCAAMRAWALASKSACMVSSSSASCAAAAVESASGSGSLAPSVRRETFVSPLTTSRGPMSTRSGTPLRSHSKYLAPARKWSRESTCTRTPAASSADFSEATAFSTADASAGSLHGNGTMTTCIGATRGGRTNPASSEWLMTRAPMSLVVMPHEVAHTYSSPESRVWYFTSNAFAKFCPRKWEVPHCSAHPFCISPSIV
mmetsp:Transcript_41340/g.95776  ORF Transcript_41340/g.95776 Transcript_41340/m.95776 type:complete len:241 (+) Transcript_41340:329-1051(+)